MIDKDCLPNFLIIGAAKSGTTSLHEYLNQHPEIFMSNPKEPRFFLVWNNPEQKQQNIIHQRLKFNLYDTVEKYSALFEGGKALKIRGESSPQYLLYPHCAAKIKKLIPDVKIIAVLRNPADRAFSQYQMHKKWRIEVKSFQEAITEETKNARSSYPVDMRYLESGKYHQQLEIYFQLFDQDQIKVFLYEDFKADPLRFTQNIFKFLKVDENFIPDLSADHNVSTLRRYSKAGLMDRTLSYTQKVFSKINYYPAVQQIKNYRFYRPALEDKIRESLSDYFEEDIGKLETLLNLDLSSWRYQKSVRSAS